MTRVCPRANHGRSVRKLSRGFFKICSSNNRENHVRCRVKIGETILINNLVILNEVNVLGKLSDRNDFLKVHRTFEKIEGYELIFLMEIIQT